MSIPEEKDGKQLIGVGITEKGIKAVQVYQKTKWMSKRWMLINALIEIEVLKIKMDELMNELRNKPCHKCSYFTNKRGLSNE